MFYRFSTTWLLVFFIACVCLTCLPVPAVIPAEDETVERGRARPPKFITDLLRVFPEDTEALIVARDVSFGRKPDTPEWPEDFATSLRRFAMPTCPKPCQWLLENCEPQSIVHGGRNYDVVSSFGFCRSESASVVRFETDLPEEDRKALLYRLDRTAEKTREMAGETVYVFPADKSGMEPWVDLKDWQGQFVALVDAKTMVTSSSDRFIEAVLNRMKADRTTPALPLDLPEWNHVDMNAELWALQIVQDDDGAKSPLHGYVWMMEEWMPDFHAVFVPKTGRDITRTVRSQWWPFLEKSNLPVDCENMDDGTVHIRYRNGRWDRDDKIWLHAVPLGFYVGHLQAVSLSKD